MEEKTKLSQGEKRRNTLVEKYGSEEAYLAQLKEWGSQGGKKSTGGFDNQTPERRKEIAKMGVERRKVIFDLGREALEERLRQHGIDI